MIDTALPSSAPGTTWKFRPLLISLLLLVLLSPYLEGRELFLKALGLAVLLSGLYTVSRDKRVCVYACILGIPTLTAEAMNILTVLRHAEVVARVGAVFFLSFTTAAILWHVFTAAEVTSDTLYGAACAYFLSGVTWATLYTLIEMLQPGAFAINVAQRPHQGITWFDLVFFSFVTLTSVGYGDITPVTPQVRSLAVLEAVFGVLYNAILIARLMGLYHPKGGR